MTKQETFKAKGEYIYKLLEYGMKERRKLNEKGKAALKHLKESTYYRSKIQQIALADIWENGTTNGATVLF